MKKIVIGVSECEPGMKMAETIYNNYGAIIVGENTILDAHIIRKLQNLGFAKVRVYSHTQEVITANSSEIFKAQYNENVEVIKSMLHDISAGKDIKMEMVDTVSDAVYRRINENRDIVNCINQVRGVDQYTYVHSMNVSLISMLIGKWLKMDPEGIKKLVQAGLLHDIGKSKIQQDIINKPGKLSDKEFEEIKKHPIIGFRIIDKIPDISKDVCKAVLMHHEREDGSGYPVGLKGSRINHLAKIIAVADIYDAMTSDRVYKEKESPFEVFELMENNAFGYLDPVVTRTFLSNIAAYYIGDFVKLSTGEIGEIIHINSMHISQPVVRVGESYADLSAKTEVKIAQLL